MGQVLQHVEIYLRTMGHAQAVLEPWLRAMRQVKPAMRACMSACARTCVRARVRVCVCACVRARICASRGHTDRQEIRAVNITSPLFAFTRIGANGAIIAEHSDPNNCIVAVRSATTEPRSRGADVTGVSPSPGADVAGASPSPGADVVSGEPTAPVQVWLVVLGDSEEPWRKLVEPNQPRRVDATVPAGGRVSSYICV